MRYFIVFDGPNRDSSRLMPDYDFVNYLALKMPGRISNRNVGEFAEQVEAGKLFRTDYGQEFAMAVDFDQDYKVPQAYRLIDEMRT